MNIHELVQHQDVWEKERGIDNGNFNVPRIRVELDEAAAEKDPLKALEELIDVIIITSGGMAKAAIGAGIPFEDVDKMIEAKLKINSQKYHKELFEANPVNTAITFARHYWHHEPSLWEVDGDYY